MNAIAILDVYVRKSGIATLTIGVLVVVGALNGVDLWRSREDRLRDAEQRAATLSLVLAEYITGAFSAADTALRQLALRSRRIGGPSAPEAEWGPLIATTRSALAGIGAISVIDAEGIIRHSTRTNIVGQSRRKEFAAMQPFGSGDAPPLLGAPLRSPVDPGVVVIPIGRRITSEVGAFEGAVVASFMPAEARRFFRSLNIGDGGVVTAIHTNGTILFREPSNSDPIGEPAHDNPILVAARSTGKDGTLRGPLASGGADMITAFHIAGPFIVAVSLDQGGVLVRFDREVRWSVSLLAVAAALLGVTLIVLFRQMDAKVAAQRALEEARQAEAARLRASNDQLAAMVDREQLARHEAETASALKDQFLMTISHELRTPLTAIAGWARLLVDDMVTEEQRNAALRTIDRNAQTQTRLIDDLLDVSGIMTGKLRLDVRRVQIDDVIRAAVEAVRPAAAAKSVEIVAAVASDTGFVMGDGERLQQVIWNLLSNAVKFTANGGHVRVTASRGDEHVQIVVSDNGIGIPDAFLPHVFDRFRQADTGSSRRHGGLGLGLSIVRSLVELHGGTIDAQSEGEGKGATFTVRLPASIRRIA